MRHAPDVLVRLAPPSAGVRPASLRRPLQTAGSRHRARHPAAGAVLLTLCGSMACASNAARPNAKSANDPVASGPSAPLAPSDLAKAAAWNYRAPALCPSQARLFEQIALRAPALSAEDVARAVSSSIDIDVQQSGSEWLGRVAFQSATGAVSREVTGAGCEEVVVALALITSLWLRPRDAEAGAGAATELEGTAIGARRSLADTAQISAAARVAAQRSSWAERAVRADGEAQADRADDDINAAANDSAALDSTGAGADATAARSLPREPLDASAFGAGEPDAANDTDSSASGEAGSHLSSQPRLQLVGLLGYASEPAAALSARLQLERWGSASVSSWSAALGVAYAGGRHENERLGGAALRLFHAQIELCPPGLDISPAWVRACAHGRAGALHFSADTDRMPDARSLWRPWAALGPSVHLGLPISPSFSLRLLAELSLVLVRDEFATERPLTAAEPSPADVFTFYEISPVSFDVGLGAAHVF